jgi:hypothetical protein
MPLSRLIALIINARPEDVRRTSADATNRKTGTESERPLLVQDLSAARGLACVTSNRLPAPVHPCGRTQTNPFFTMSKKKIARPGKAPAAKPLKRVAMQRVDEPVLQPNGGARRDRTDDLMLAKHALSQLSYGPSGLARQAPGQANGYRRSR